jgi:hypothetical protein
MALLYILSITGYFLCQELSNEDCSGSFLYKDFFFVSIVQAFKKRKATSFVPKFKTF